MFKTLKALAIKAIGGAPAFFGSVWFKVALVAAYSVFVVHVHNIYLDHLAKEKLEAEAKAKDELTKESNAVVSDGAAKEDTAKKDADKNIKEWSDHRVKQNPTDCNLSPNAIRLLRVSRGTKDSAAP